MLTDGTAAAAADEEIDSVAPRAPPAAAEPPAAAGPSPLGLRAVRLFGEAGPGGPGGPGAPAAAEAALDFKLAAAVLRSGGGGGSGSDEDEVSEVESFILDQEDLDNPVLKTTSELFLSSAAEGADLRTVDPETQARLEALLEAAGIGKLSTADGKAFADPEVLRRLTSSVSCALDEAAAALTRMRAENNHNNGQVDNRSLAEACSDGDVNAVRKLLDEGRSVNEHTEEGESLLCLACSAGYYELAQVLLAMHANVEDRGNKGDITPLMAAASGGYVDIVKLLLVHCADVNAQSSTGNTALTYACAGGFVDVVKVLLKAGANIEDHNENGHTPLMEAASAGHVEVARVLLEYGAGINTHSNEFKESALTLACYKGHLDMVRFLLEAGADQEHKTDEMHTALMEACMDGHVEVARLLLDSGAQVNMPADSFESPLTLAACGGHVELAALLIERGANLEEVNDEGYTPLMEAAREGHEEMVALLLAQGANINAQTEETQETALTLACCGGFSEVADFLIKAGADIELGCSTPLMEAAQEGHLELVKYLLAAGANVHATTATGDTALTYACENGHTDVADVLLQAGADLEHESEGGRTPLMKAARAGHLCTVQFLISKGANVNRATANNDHTVVSLACAGGHLAVVELLLAHGADPTHRLKDGSTMLIEAAKGGHTNVVSYLLDYPNNVLSVPAADLSQLTPPSQDQSQVPRVPVHTLAMVVPPQEPDRTPQENSPPLLGVVKGASKQKSSSLQVADKDLLPPFHPYQPLECIVEETEGKLNELGQRISAIEKAQLKSLELIQGEPLNKDKIEELKKNREEQVQKKKKILKELQKVERQLQMKTQQQFTKEYLETKGQTDTPPALQQQCSLTGVFPEVEADKGLPEDNFSGLPQVDTILSKDDEQHQSPPPAEQIEFVPIQPLPAPQCNFSGNLGYNGTESLELQKALGNQQNVGQQQQIAGQGLLVQEPDGLMVATPAQTLTDTLDDLIAAVNSRVPSGSTSSSHTTESPTPEPCPQAASNVPPQSVLPMYPSVDIDAHTESNHDTALTLACAGGHEELVSVLIARGANIEHRDKKGFTPLILAATAGHVGVVEILLDKGGDIEAQSERTKDTPLSLACSGGRQEVQTCPQTSGSALAVGGGGGTRPRCRRRAPPKPGPLERGRPAAAVARRRLRVPLLAAAERRWSRRRRRRSVLPPQAARSPGAGRSGSGTATGSSGGGGERRGEAARAGWLRCGGPCAAWRERLQGKRGSGGRQERGERRRQRMAARRRQRRGLGGGRALLAAVLLCVWGRAAAERLRYAIPEELGRGSLVGPLARDLGLSADELPARKLQVASAGKKQLQYFTVSEENGNLYVNERLDREQMCSASPTCSVSFEVLMQNPLNIFHVEVAIEDVNDNSPRFLRNKFQLEINELTSPGARFYLGIAEDPDVGSNSLQGYELEANGYFTVEVKESQDGSKSAELVLRHSLDRESEPSLQLLLTALDGGDPPRTGTAELWINVTDANDNPPVFAQDGYRVSLREDTPPGTIVLNVSASDADAGTNAHITYGFGEMPDKVLQKFVVDGHRGMITLQEALDFEDTSTFSLAVEATDIGGLVAHCKVEVEVLDVNDNPPEITILSLSSPVPEDAPAGTAVALLNVNDPDSGENGQVSCELSGEAPLSIVASSGGSYKVVTAGALDREQASEHRVTVVARDRGRPALWSSTELVLEVSDVNDNAPVFEEAAYSAYVAENNAAGALVLRVQARDADAGANGRVSYWLAGGSAGAAGAAPLVSVEARSGALYAQRSLDYEQCREFTLVVRAQDGGSPARSSTATVRVFVLDRNDNAPRVLWPVAAAAAGEAAAGAPPPFEVVPRSAEAGYLVAKVVAVDADAGRNAWLSYELVQASEPALFRVGLHSGEVRTARAVSERDAAKQRLVAVVKDHGQPALSATATLHVVLAESLQEALPELSERAAGAEAAAAAAELQFYLVLALALLSALLVLSVALAVLARLRRAGPPAVLRCLGAQRFSVAGAAFPADFCEGTLPYSYNLCVAAPARAVPEAAWPPPPPPVPVLSAEELLGGDSCEKPSLNSSAVEGVVPTGPDAPQSAIVHYAVVNLDRLLYELENLKQGFCRWHRRGDRLEKSGRCVRQMSPSRSARCLQCREEAAGAAADREEREELGAPQPRPLRIRSVSRSVLSSATERSAVVPVVRNRAAERRRCRKKRVESRTGAGSAE
ncbi:ankyrin repeat and KH domain-containing protein 1 [Lonchura striata]